jgi:glycosyltransferase involved in cell wall biosynthesis
MERKLKILVASETYPPDLNGCARFGERLAQMLAEKGHDVLVIGPSPIFKDTWEEVNENLKVYRLASIPLKPFHPYFRGVWPWRLRAKIKKAIEEFQPDLVHIQNHFTVGRTVFRIAKFKNLPVVGTNHFMPENLTEYFPKFLEPLVCKHMWKDFLKIYGQLDYVTAPTCAALKMMKDMGLSVPSQVISNGLDLNGFQAVAVKPDLHARFGLKAELPIFLFVGRLERDKNIDLILKAMALLGEKAHFQILLVGKGRDAKVFEKLAQKLGLGKKVIFTGAVADEDLKQFYSAAQVYIGSGSAELQGLAVMEAMAHGLPVLAANAVALPELVENGKNGYLFELNSESLAERIVLISKDPEELKAMGKESLKRIQAHDKELTAQAFLKLYRELIPKKP